MKKIGFLFLIIVFILSALIVAFLFRSSFIKENPKRGLTNEANSIPTFTEIEIDFTHILRKPGHKFAGGAMIDIDNDGVEELFLGGGSGQEDVLYIWNGETFVSTNVWSGIGVRSEEATYGALSFDVNSDGENDLIIARESGVYIMANRSGHFSESKIDFEMEENTIPMAISASDINHDGFVDLYVTTFSNDATFKLATFNDPSNRRRNVMLLNNGDHTFTDITETSGLEFSQNSFLGVFVDLNEDGWQDLVVASNTDTIHIYSNQQDGTFNLVSQPTDIGFWMGLSVGDYDNDGDMDVFSSNVGTTLPRALVRGDLRDDQALSTEWTLLQNQGNFVFKDVTEEVGLDGFEFGWGSQFEDFNLDGLEDLIVAQNLIHNPLQILSPDPGRFFIQNDLGMFNSIGKQAHIVNKKFGQSQLTTDINKDGYVDLVYINVDGPARIFLNDGGKNNYVTISFPETVEYLGTKVSVTRTDEVVLTQQVMTSTGLISDPSSDLHFGLGLEDIKRVTATFPDGTIKQFDLEKNNRYELNK